MAKGRILISSRIVGTTVTDPILMLEAEGFLVVKHPLVASGKSLNANELQPLVQGIDGMIVGEDEVSRQVIEGADRLRVISKSGVGVDQIDIRAATERGIVVTNTPGANANAVADLTFGLILSIARRIPFSHIATRQAKWAKFTGAEIWQKTIGIVGVGEIGKAVARRALGFQMRILGYDTYQDHALAQEVGLRYVPLQTVFQEADIVTLHVPLSKVTQGMVTRDHFRMMKKTAYLINTARGGLMRGEDLYDALVHGELAGAALDVYETEPPIDNPLLTLDNVVTTSHIGALTWESMQNMGRMAAKNVIDVLHGRRPAHAVNPEVFTGV